jgi:hypothetical protein
VVTTAASRIFYYCYSHDRPTGGQKQAYRHVDILNRHGFDARVLHLQERFRLRWFENDTRVIDHAAFRREHNPVSDVLVVPEDLGEAIQRFPGRKVVFNQNLYHGFQTFGEKVPAVYPYQRPDVVAAFAVSEHNAAALRFACPSLPVFRVFYAIDPARFTFTPITSKRAQIACIAKAPSQLSAVFHVLNLRARQGLNALGAFEWVFIKGKTEREVADILSASLVFVFLGIEEGLPLMPLEAMASGCLVLGVSAGPVREYLPSSALFPVGEVQGIAERIETIAAAFPDRLGAFEADAAAGLETTRRYSLEQEEESVLSAWRVIARGCR